MNKPTLEDIIAARERISGVVQTTPMELSRFLSGKLGDTVHLKCENLQRTGAYKLRGAHNLLAQLSDEARAKGVVAASAGNHAQGVAYAATALGVKSTIFMPRGAALPKLQATRDDGADIRLRGSVFQETLAAAVDFVEETGAHLCSSVPPPAHHRGTGHRGPRDPRAAAGCRHGRRADRRAGSSPVSRLRSRSAPNSWDAPFA